MIKKITKRIDAVVEDVLCEYVLGYKQFADPMNNRMIKILRGCREFTNLNKSFSDIIMEHQFIHPDCVGEYIEEIVEAYYNYVINYSDEFDSNIEDKEIIHSSICEILEGLFSKCVEDTRPVIITYLKCFVHSYVSEELSEYESSNHWGMDYYLLTQFLDESELIERITSLLYQYYIGDLKHNEIVLDSMADEAMELYIKKYNFDTQIARYKAHGIFRDIYYSVSACLNNNPLAMAS